MIYFGILRGEYLHQQTYSLNVASPTEYNPVLWFTAMRCTTVAFAGYFALALARQTGDPIVAGEGGGLEDEFACSKQPLSPLNKATLLTDGAILASNYEITSCSEDNIEENGIGPCLFDLGFEGLELSNPDEDWTCTNELDPSTCFGLTCDQYHVGKQQRSQHFYFAQHIADLYVRDNSVPSCVRYRGIRLRFLHLQICQLRNGSRCQ